MELDDDEDGRSPLVATTAVGEAPSLTRRRDGIESDLVAQASWGLAGGRSLAMPHGGKSGVADACDCGVGSVSWEGEGLSVLRSERRSFIACRRRRRWWSGGVSSAKPRRG